MARLTVVPATVVGPYPTGQPAAGSLDITFVAPAVAADGIGFAATGREILIVQNTTAGALTFTVTSRPDPQGRTQDIAAYSVAASGFAAFNFSQIAGWIQTDGMIYVAGSTTGVKFAVLRY